MISGPLADAWIDWKRHPISDLDYRNQALSEFNNSGALVLRGFFSSEFVSRVVAESVARQGEAFYANSTHNVYLTPQDPQFSDDHAFNRQLVSSKGLIADDQISMDSPLRDVYEDDRFRAFLCALLGVEAVYPYADSFSSINVHYAPRGRELGWHFDNSSFAVTTLLQQPQRGGIFEYVPEVRDSDTGEMAFDRVDAVLNGAENISQLNFDPGDLVLFRGRNALHRVTPTEGSVTRVLAVFAYNDEPGVGLSRSALETFYGRTN